MNNQAFLSQRIYQPGQHPLNGRLIIYNSYEVMLLRINDDKKIVENEVIECMRLNKLKDDCFCIPIIFCYSVYLI
ncbi:hypothetical protein MXB_4358 [Myxobolus squamalis]|nr:hypothetical protein MXB_4358 [Myxobolus squamalis]